MFLLRNFTQESKTSQPLPAHFIAYKVEIRLLRTWSLVHFSWNSNWLTSGRCVSKKYKMFPIFDCILTWVKEWTNCTWNIPSPCTPARRYELSFFGPLCFRVRKSHGLFVSVIQVHDSDYFITAALPIFVTTKMSAFSTNPQTRFAI